MTYILIFNTSELSCETDQLVLTQAQAKHIDSTELLLNEISGLKDSEQKKVKDAESNGFKKGCDEGLSISLKEAKSLFIEYLESISERVIESHTLSEQAILDLALNITQKIALEIGSEDMITGIALRAIKNLKSDKPLEIRVNSGFADSVERKLQHLTNSNNGSIPHIEVVPDPNIGELDCIITSDSGVTEASFDQQLHLLKQQLIHVTQTSSLIS
jgi:flagellar assembly protein FliH